MHSLAAIAPDCEQALPPDIWAPTLTDLEQLAQIVVGASDRPWVRKNKEWSLAGTVDLGADAMRLGDEFKALATEVSPMLAVQETDAALRAAAYFHLRFERVHPLRDGNGRVGRILLAAQCWKSYSVPISEFLDQLDSHKCDYAAVHPARKPEFQFELLVDLLGRILAIPISGDAKLPRSLEPRYPDRRFKTRPGQTVKYVVRQKGHG